MKTYQRFITEKRGDTVVFSFGRFNPPTVGHEKLITAVETVANSKGGDYFIYPSQTQDPKKNPLNHRTKISYMLKMFSKHKLNIVKSKAKHALDVAVELYNKKKYLNLVMVVGSDRVTEFQRVLHNYNGQEARHGFYEFENIEVISAGERDPDSEGVEGMSASKMREAAVQGDFQVFRMGTPTALSDDDTMKLMNSIRKGMKLAVIKEGVKWKDIDFNYREVPQAEQLDTDKELTFEDFTTRYLHTSLPAYDLFEELVISMSHDKKEAFYLKETLKITDRFLELRAEALRTEKIDQIDLFEMENLAKKQTKFMQNINADHLDNSFIYKYISEIGEVLEWGDPKARRSHEKDTPGQDDVLKKYEKVIKWLSKKMDVGYDVAFNLVRMAMEKGINPLKIQQKWSILSPTLLQAEQMLRVLK